MIGPDRIGGLRAAHEYLGKTRASRWRIVREFALFTLSVLFCFFLVAAACVGLYALFVA